MEHKRVFSNPGSAFKDEFTSVLSKNGEIEVKRTGKSDLYEFIQSFADSTDINLILKKFASGNGTLNLKQGFYADVTEVPNNYYEAQNKLNAFRNAFDQLDPNIKETFGSVENYLKFINQNNKDLLEEDYQTKILKAIESIKVNNDVKENVE